MCKLNHVDEPLIFELRASSRIPTKIPIEKLPKGHKLNPIPKDLVRETGTLGFPKVNELDVVRHFTRLSQKNFCVDTHFYPLGSCTMKYNPKALEMLIPRPLPSYAHPYAPEFLIQGFLKILYELETYLKDISGMDAISMQPAAGAHGELTGLLVIKRYFAEKGFKKTTILIPDTAHGTNPASCAIAGFKPVVVKSGKEGILELDPFSKVDLDNVAALMITNPNTLGLFEKNMSEIAKLLHRKNAFIYMDGANLNALLGILKPSALGVDVMHFNLHKTFGSPHGGGGPGAGPIGVVKKLEPYLPRPRVSKENEHYFLCYDFPKTIGRVRSFIGNVSVLIKAWMYICLVGKKGLKNIAVGSVLNANYIKEKLKDAYHLPYNVPCMHECVFSDKYQSLNDIKVIDIAKRLIDYGFHPPTISFPLIIPGAIMIEPTETESLQTIQAFINAMNSIALEAKEDPEVLKKAPHHSPVGRVNEVKANRELKLIKL